ncbi:MAG: RNA polymerase factor sigma-32 [Rhodovibrionaceae bacterium]
MPIYEDPNSRRAHARLIRKSMAAPLLTREEEFALARAWRDHKDEAALHRLIESYTRLTVSVAGRFRNYGLPMSDLVQEGVIGLLQAAERFDPDRDVRFSTYATWWIRSAIQDFILRNWSIVRTGTTAAQKSLFFNLRRLRARIVDANPGELGHSGRVSIAEQLSVNLSDVEAMEARLSFGDQSLNVPVGEEGGEDWLGFLVDERAGPEEVVRGRHDSGVRSRSLRQALETLDRRERKIIESRRLSEEGATLESLGEELGVSKERVRQLEHRALGKLRDSLKQHGGAPTDLLVEA